ncbi:GSCOCG00004493001-RA-CDS [Cotesia congregata]|nr:GSCOCG00004493001-RA-CDS [Cotesia congregata]
MIRALAPLQRHNLLYFITNPSSVSTVLSLIFICATTSLTTANNEFLSDRDLDSFSSTSNFIIVIPTGSTFVIVLISGLALISIIFSSGAKNDMLSAQDTPAIPPPTITKGLYQSE